MPGTSSVSGVAITKHSRSVNVRLQPDEHFLDVPGME
jgi:hypothetical protein